MHLFLDNPSVKTQPKITSTHIQEGNQGPVSTHPLSHSLSSNREPAPDMNPAEELGLDNTSQDLAAEKRKRKRSALAAKIRKVQDVPYDEQGHIVLPLTLGIVTLHQLGEIVWDRPDYHNERYIFPVGFTTSRYISIHRYISFFF